MKKIFAALLAIAFGPLALSQDLRVRIGEIEFFGVNGYNIKSLRASMPAMAGQEVSESEFKEIKKSIREAVRNAVGQTPTDVTLACCDPHNLAIIYIGLPGKNAGAFRYKPAPSGPLRLPYQPVRLYEEAMNLNAESVQKNSAEDTSKGYSLSLYPPLRAKELAIREYAIRNESLLRHVALRSAAAKHRAIATHLLGYARRSTAQINTLISASRDPDEEVRNNALRALGVLAQADSVIARKIPADWFVDMLNSGSWTDRNKANLLLATLSEKRDPRLLHQLRVGALPALIEMARWGNSLHASYPRLILGRVARIPEKQLRELVGAGEVEQIVSAAERAR